MNSPLTNEARHWSQLKERLLEAFPELAEDDEVLFDTLDGETSLTERLAALLRSAMYDEAQVAGLLKYIEKLVLRKHRFRDRAHKKRQIALHIMADLGIKNIKAPDLSASRRAVAPAVVIINENELSDEFMRITRSPDKSAIKEALKKGCDVPGARLGNGSETIMVKI